MFFLPVPLRFDHFLVLLCVSDLEHSFLSSPTVDETDRDDWISLHKETLPQALNCYSAVDGHSDFLKTLSSSPALKKA